jgi:phosphoribosylamine--glycine ligase
MGAYAPAPVVTPEVHAKVIAKIVEPTIRGLLAEGIDYRGVLFIGLMIAEGEPSVLEFNVRFGDPEATVILPLEDDVWTLLASAAAGSVMPEPHAVAPASRAALSVVLAAERYPEAPVVGDRIEFHDVEAIARAYVHHAGTRRDEDGLLVTAGGRVLAVTGEGATLADAQAQAYAAVAQVHFRGMHYRRDIGFRGLQSRSENH